MKMIGIKLADGSFYPLLEEGVPAKKTLDLTTVRDNQTAITVDLYRSETNSMENAEYAATLKIDNLLAHPNGEPDISFTVALDEQNKLFAEIDDGESGGHNAVTVSLVEGTEPRHPNDDNGYGPAITTGAAIASGGLLHAAGAQEDATIEPPDFSDLDLPEELDLTKPVSESASNASDAADTPPTDDIFAPPDVYSTEAIDEKKSDTEFFDDGTGDADFSDIDLPTFDDTPTEKTPIENETADFSTVDNADDFHFDAADLPSFDDTPAEKTSIENEATDFSTADNTDDFHFDEADLPSFDEVPPVQSETSDIDRASGDHTFSDDFFDGIDMPSNETDTATRNIDSLDDLQFGETDDTNIQEGTTATKYQSKTVIKKKTKAPVLICLLCALICVIATILILFVIPSKYNVLLSHASHTDDTVVLPARDTAAPSREEPVMPAKPDEIVVAPRAETVAPVRPAAASKSTGDVAYRIKWGDTLWDIADAYYKNPWRYPRIARYNNIKNPDYIISGTTIRIPVE
ncbi:LysM peptidoglycan-binding domain-containing protein [Treponema sp. Marseille-Q4523]|uniref:Hsp70 family protein n=1 Tax=Treponema sp. Marseille-Q4523 TaxID=2810610 RepID=UPI0019603EB6|nr:LysM peptidoglycan-binding domain-containing protein [Treponema sp. Marseille-Q4523]MBM7023631.1 LysM peptidoglycan-binding domain-containing protein [Treponema sp. Marseille-Q4523]